jgi:hypothetical protein
MSIAGVRPQRAYTSAAVVVPVAGAVAGAVECAFSAGQVAHVLRGSGRMRPPRLSQGRRVLT